MEKIKIILVGATQVGKTCIIKQYISQEFEGEHITTVASEKFFKEIEFENKKISLEIWDTVGQENFRTINTIFMKNAKIAIIVYDITNKKSFDELNYWVEAVKNANSDKIICCIVGNKSDLYEERVIEEEEGKKFADEHNFLFFEGSAKEYDNVENIFIKCFEKYIQELNKLTEEERKDKTTGIHLEKEGKEENEDKIEKNEKNNRWWYFC